MRRHGLTGLQPGFCTAPCSVGFGLRGITSLLPQLESPWPQGHQGCCRGGQEIPRRATARDTTGARATALDSQQREGEEEKEEKTSFILQQAKLQAGITSKGV